MGEERPAPIEMHGERDPRIAGRRILVVGINYAPEPTGSAPYTAGLSEMFASAGAHVDVIAGVPHYPAWEVDPRYRYRFRADEVINGVDVHRARHFVPRHQSALTRMAWEGTFLLNGGTLRLHQPPEAIIASSPSLSGAVIGASRARRFRVPFGVVVQDLVGQAAAQSGVSGGDKVASAVGRVESWALARADLIAIVSESFREQLHAYAIDDRRIRAFPNWVHIPPSTRPRSEVRQGLGWDDSTFVAMHTGNMGMKQDLMNLIEAAKHLPSDSRVRIVLMGDGSQREDLMRGAEGVTAVQFLPPAEDDMYADILKAADLLLVNERPSVGDMSLPSKLTSYFSSGRPVLAAVSESGACARELTAASGSAERIDPGDPAALARRIEYLASNPVRLLEMGRLGEDYARLALSAEGAKDRAINFATELLARSSTTGVGGP